MSFFAFLFVCIQACLVQNVFGQCIGSHAAGLTPSAALASPTPFPYGGAVDIIAAPFVASVTAPFTEPFLAKLAAGPFGVYGGAGTGELAVAGDLPAAGNTFVAGQVSLLGAVEFGGIVPAGGTVSITGSCSYGCPNLFV